MTTKQLTLQAKNSGQPQGQWLNEAAAERLIAKHLDELSHGAQDVTIPLGVGQVILPNGRIRAATKARLVPSGNGVKTAFPILD